MTDLLSLLGSRVSLTLAPADLARLTWWADRKGVPLADVLHEAVALYLGSVRAVHRAVHGDGQVREREQP